MRLIAHIIAAIGLFLLGCSANGESIQKSEVAVENQIDTKVETSDDTPLETDDSTEVFQEYLGEKLNPIREYVSNIDSINEWSLMKSVSLDLNGKKVTTVYFLRMAEIQKINVIDQDADSQGESNYYFKNDQIVYAHEKGMEEMGADGLVLNKNHSFFEDGILIRSISNQDCGSPFNQEYRDEEQARILKDIAQIRAAFSL